jgi:hypothetical protein
MMQLQQGLTYHQCHLEDQEFNKSYLLDIIVFYDRIYFMEAIFVRV